MNDVTNHHTPGVVDIPGQVEQMMTVREVARLLRVDPRTLHRFIAEGKVPAHLYARTGGHARGRIRFTADQVRELQRTWSGVDTPEPPQQPPHVQYRPRRRSA